MIAIFNRQDKTDEGSKGVSSLQTLELLVKLAQLSLTSVIDNNVLPARREGYEIEMRKLGLAESRVISFGTPPISMKQGGEAIVRLLEQWPKVEAAICVSDLPAFGAVMECQRRNWKVPEQIAIAGFGDFEISGTCYPTITTFGVHCYDIGNKAGGLLLRAIEGERYGRVLATETIVTDYNVIQHESI